MKNSFEENKNSSQEEIEKFDGEKEKILRKITIDHMELKDVPKRLQADKKIVLEAIRRNDGLGHGFTLESASEELRNDKEVVLVAVKKNGLALVYASSKLRNDKEVVLEAIKNHRNAYDYVSAELRADPQIVLVALKNGENFIDPLPKKFWDDKRIREILEDRIIKE